MPNINVTERQVSPKLDQGLLTGVIFGGYSAVWLLLIGLLSGAALAIFHPPAGFVLGDKAFDAHNSNGDALIGLVVHFIGAAIDGIIFALAWPKLRAYGTWTPSILFMIALAFLTYEILGRILVPGLGSHLNDFAYLTAGFIGGCVFAYRYRHS